jgi:hypothetical protein
VQALRCSGVPTANAELVETTVSNNPSTAAAARNEHFIEMRFPWLHNPYAFADATNEPSAP